MANRDDGCGCKVERIASEYELEDVDSWLTAEWQDEVSVRQLATELNKDIIEVELSTANVSQVKWSRERVHKALRTDELSNAEEIEVQNELDRDGIDVERLSSDLVSHQTVYRHLTQCLGVSKSKRTDPEKRREQAKDTVFALQRRTESVTETTVETLQSAGVTHLGDVEVLTDIRVVCNDCDHVMGFETAIDEGCHCDTP